MTTASRTVASRLRAECAVGLDSVSAREWDALVPPGSGPLKHGYLTAWETAELPELRSRPLLAYAPGSQAPVAACPAYFYLLDIPTTRNPQAGRYVRAIRRLFPRFLYARTYELGNPTPLTNPFLVPDEQLRPDAVRALIEAGLEESKHAGAEFVLVQNFASRSTPAGEELARRGFAPVPILPTSVIPVQWGSFEEYLDAMRAKYRRRAQQTLEHSGHLNVEHLREFAGIADELARLWRCVHERATEIKREVLTAEYFRAASALEDTSVVLMRRGDGSIAAFGLLLHDHPWLAWLFCGFPLEAGLRERAYFRLLYEIVRVAIDGGYEQVELGMTTLEAKIDAGGVPVPLYAWIKHRNPLLQRAILATGRGPLRPQRWEPRHVFKDPPPSAAELVQRRRLTS